jgi:predicted transglutaminase-like cysteine proteinase
MDSVSVFGASELKVKKSNTFHRWDKMLERYAAQDARLAKGRGRINEKRGLQLWEEVISGLKGMDPVTQIKEINSYFNAFTYQSDAKNYAIQDYWATPYQFLSRAKGDCEDFSAAKYLALRSLGFHSNQLRLVVGYDRVRGGAHTVLLVVVGGRVLMLDIGDNTIVEMSGVKIFDPFYSVTESEGWMHMKRA